MGMKAVILGSQPVLETKINFPYVQTFQELFICPHVSD